MRLFLRNFKMYRAFGCGVFTALRRSYKSLSTYKRNNIRGSYD